MYLPQFAMRRQDDDISHLLNQVHHCDAMALLRRLPDASVDLIATDPPYHAIVGELWDNQWRDASAFITWLSAIIAEMKRVLKSNGSLYLCASHKLQAYVELSVAEHFKVLNNITWLSNGATTKRADRTILRSYIPTTEHIIFAEHGTSDAFADEIAGFTKAEQALKRRIFGDYLQSEFDRAGVSRKEIAALFPSATGNLTGCVSNWILGHNVPTQTQYELMRNYLGRLEYLRTEYEELRTEYEELRTEYEELRTEYEELRRYFDLDIAGENECNVWYFKPPSERMHPTQKPLDMLEHILQVSSRLDAIVLDPFCGSGTTAIAARKTGRQFICGDNHLPYVELARKRLQDTDPFQATELPDGSKQLSLFEGKGA